MLRLTQNSFVMGWPWDMGEGTFPPPCVFCDISPPVVGVPTTDFVDSDGSPNIEPTPPPPGKSWPGDFSPTPGGVPEIPQWAMLLIGFAGLGLIGRASSSTVWRVQDVGVEAARQVARALRRG